jgi:rhamnogalacturonyl hydrolase YesR
MKKVFFCILLITGSLQVFSQQLPDYASRIKILYSGINTRLAVPGTNLYRETVDSTKNDNRFSYLWPLCAYLQSTNEMEVLEPKTSYMLPVAYGIDKYHNTEPPVPGYQATVYNGKPDDRYYDDDEWIAIAYLDGYNRTHNKKYLEDSESICRFLLSGLDTVSGGGFYWKEKDKGSKNTCSNGPGILVLLQLYKINHTPEYLKTAIGVYNWANKYLQAPEGFYYDNIRVPSLKIGKATYTYNTGSMLQANVLLYQITKDKKYLIEAQRVAKAGRDHFFKNGRLPNGNYWFNAVMLRGYQELYRVDKNKQWMDFFMQDADAVWTSERDATNMVGPKPLKSLIDQSAMIEIYARLAQIGKMR